MVLKEAPPINSLMYKEVLSFVCPPMYFIGQHWILLTGEEEKCTQSASYWPSTIILLKTFVLPKKSFSNVALFTVMFIYLTEHLTTVSNKQATMVQIWRVQIWRVGNNRKSKQTTLFLHFSQWKHYKLGGILGGKSSHEIFFLSGQPKKN